MYCMHCGKENQDGAEFCVHCGRAIESVASKKADTGSSPVAQEKDLLPDRRPMAIAMSIIAGLEILCMWLPFIHIGTDISYSVWECLFNPELTFLFIGGITGVWLLLCVGMLSTSVFVGILYAILSPIWLQVKKWRSTFWYPTPMFIWLYTITMLLICFTGNGLYRPGFGFWAVIILDIIAYIVFWPEFGMIAERAKQRKASKDTKKATGELPNDSKVTVKSNSMSMWVCVGVLVLFGLAIIFIIVYSQRQSVIPLEVWNNADNSYIVSAPPERWNDTNSYTVNAPVETDPMEPPSEADFENAAIMMVEQWFNDPNNPAADFRDDWELISYNFSWGGDEGGETRYVLYTTVRIYCRYEDSYSTEDVSVTGSVWWDGYKFTSVSYAM